MVNPLFLFKYMKKAGKMNGVAHVVEGEIPCDMANLHQ